MDVERFNLLFSFLFPFIFDFEKKKKTEEGRNVFSDAIGLFAADCSNASHYTVDQGKKKFGKTMVFLLHLFLAYFFFWSWCR